MAQENYLEKKECNLPVGDMRNPIICIHIFLCNQKKMATFLKVCLKWYKFQMFLKLCELIAA